MAGWMGADASNYFRIHALFWTVTTLVPGLIPQHLLHVACGLAGITD
jgi:hypothetical protein